MKNIVGYGVGCMGILVLALVGVMYFGLANSWLEKTPAGQTRNQVEKWIEESFRGQEYEILRLGKECTFEGENGRYRLIELGLKATSTPAAPQTYVLLSRPNGVVSYHWTLEKFKEEKKKEAEEESTPERVAWRHRRWEAMLKELAFEPAEAPAAGNAK